MSERIEYLRILVEWLLDSEISGYEIEKETKVSRSTISLLRKGEAELDNVSFIKIEALAGYAEKQKEEIDFYKSCLGQRWGNLDEPSQERLWKDASCIIDERNGETLTGGECIVDFNEFLSVPGELIEENDEDVIAIEDDAVIYARVTSPRGGNM